MAEAPHDIEASELVLAFALSELQDSVDALLFGVADEAAGVDDGYLTMRVVAVVTATIACLGELVHESLGVNKVLRATQGDDINLVCVQGSLFFNLTA